MEKKWKKSREDREEERKKMRGKRTEYYFRNCSRSRTYGPLKRRKYSTRSVLELRTVHVSETTWNTGLGVDDRFPGDIEPDVTGIVHELRDHRVERHGCLSGYQRRHV